MKLSRAFFLHASLILLSAGLLLWTPLLNGFPVLHADSGTYLWSSVIFLVPQDRPIGYGLFVRAASLAPTLWMVVVAQALGTAYLMLRTAEHFLPPRRWRVWLAFGIVAATIFFSTVSLFVGMILADVFTAWLWLGAVLFLVTRHRFERVLAGMAVLIGVWTHNSHLALALAMLVGLVGVMALPQLRSRLGKRALALGGVIVFALVSMAGVNLYLRADGMPARGTDTIWLNRFQELGVLRVVLEQNCASTEWVLCESLEQVRAHDGEWRWFLFGADSPIQTVGWDKHAQEQRELVLASLECCWERILSGSIAESERQFWLMSMDGYVSPLDESMNAVLAITKNYPNELAALQNSQQQRGEHLAVRLVPLDEVTMLVIWLILLAATMVWAWMWRQIPLLAFLGGTFVFVVLNAIVVASISGAVSRYQGRVVWLIPFVTLVGVCALVSTWRERRIAAKTRAPRT